MWVEAPSQGSTVDAEGGAVLDARSARFRKPYGVAPKPHLSTVSEPLQEAVSGSPV